MNAPRPTPMRRRELVTGLGLWLAGTAGASHVAAAPLARGDVVPWPTLALLDGSTLGPADWADTAAVVVFWATWCAYCRRHNRRLEKLHQATAGQRLRVLAVAVESEDGAVRQYLQAQHFHFPTAMVVGGLREQFTPRRTVPMTAPVDRRGRLLQVVPGEMSEDDLMALAALARAPAA
jgi:thiol-disulfide isomerase/thioredoxin